MPELPEVETVCSALRSTINKQFIERIVLRHHTLRWPVPKNLKTVLARQQVKNIERRGKYILMNVDHGHLIIHLGMSGSIRLFKKFPPPPPKTHDHFDLIFANHITLRYTDPRRFGALLWTAEPLTQHPLLANLGPEPLTQAFNGDYLYQQTRKRRSNIKSVLMTSQIVAGVGNIYANEALFLAKIHPTRTGQSLSLAECEQLCRSIKLVLQRAIKAGGTTLNDFYQSDGKPGYFRLELQVYGKAGQPCPSCCQPIEQLTLNQRSTFYCSYCQHHP